MSDISRRLPSEAFFQFPWSTLGRREAAQELFRKCGEQRARVPLLARSPLFSVVIPVGPGVSREELALTLESIELQSYGRWEVLLVFESHSLRAELQGLRDERFREVALEVSGGEVAAKNFGAEQAGGDWLCFVEPGDVLSPSAFFSVTMEALEATSDLIYSHEATVSERRSRVTRFFSKPRFGWFNLAHFDAIGKSWLVRLERFRETGGFDAAAGAHHEHEFLLRLSERTEAFRLLPAYLYYRRHGASDAEADDTLRRFVEAHLKRKAVAATVALQQGTLRVTPEIRDPGALKISVIVCFKDRADWTALSLNSLTAHVGRVPVEIWAVNNGSRPDEAERVRRTCLRLGPQARVIDHEGPFNFAEMHNRAVRERCRGQFLLFLNNDVFWQKGSLDELVAWAQHDWVGTVGTLLRFPHGGVQHGGFRAFFGGSARLARVGHVQGDDRFSRENHEVFGNTFAACMMKRSTFEELGGLREIEVPNGFGDVAFNFDCLKRGLRNLYLGSVEGVHLESGSRGTDYEYWEECFIERRYPDLLQRMLREDLGYDRVPGEDYSVPVFLKEAALQKLRDKAPWLKPFKSEVKKVISRFRNQPSFEPLPESAPPKSASKDPNHDEHHRPLEV